MYGPIQEVQLFAILERDLNVIVFFIHLEWVLKGPWLLFYEGHTGHNQYVREWLTKTVMLQNGKEHLAVLFVLFFLI